MPGYLPCTDGRVLSRAALATCGIHDEGVRELPQSRSATPNLSLRGRCFKNLKARGEGDGMLWVILDRHAGLEEAARWYFQSVS